MWATWQQGNRIYLNVTDTAGVKWGTSQFQHPASLSNVSVDDTSALIAFDGKMGVMWSRQVGDATDGMYWSIPRRWTVQHRLDHSCGGSEGAAQQ